MRRGSSVVGPLILVAVGVLFLINNLNPDLSVLGVLSRFWPFLLIAWGALRLIEIGYWAFGGKPLPVAGVSGGEWAIIVFISIFGSSLFFFNNRMKWPPVMVRMKGVEMFGKAYDYPIEEKTITTRPNVRVIIDNAYGNARIVGADASEVKLTGRKTVRAFDQTGAADAARRVNVEVSRTGDDVVITAAQDVQRDDQMVTTDLEITVPKGATIQARGRRGDFDITATTGGIEIDSDNSGIRLQDIGGNVRVEVRASDIIRATRVKGSVDVKGTGHDVEMEDVEGQVTVAGNYFGDLQFRRVLKPVRFEGGIKNRTSEFRAEACPGQIRLGRGELSMEGVTGPVMIDARSKDIQISDFTHALELRVDRGDIEVRPTRAPLPRMNVVTNSGNIELVMPENARFSLKGVTERGAVENEYGDPLMVDTKGRGGVISGRNGEGADVALHADRGNVTVRKGSPAEFDQPLPPRVPKPPQAPLVVERN